MDEPDAVPQLAVEATGRRARKRRRRRLAIALAVAVAAGLLLAVAVVVVFDVGGSSWHTDDAEMAETTERLAVVSGDLDALPDPGNAKGAPQTTGCSVDSGDLFQPRVNATWEVPETEVEQRIDDLVASMLAAGWTTDDPRAADVELQRAYDGWEAKAAVYGDDGSLGDTEPYVAAEVTVVGAEPCVAE